MYIILLNKVACKIFLFSPPPPKKKCLLIIYFLWMPSILKFKGCN